MQGGHENKEESKNLFLVLPKNNFKAHLHWEIFMFTASPPTRHTPHHDCVHLFSTLLLSFHRESRISTDQFK